MADLPERDRPPADLMVREIMAHVAGNPKLAGAMLTSLLEQENLMSFPENRAIIRALILSMQRRYGVTL